MYWTLAVAIQVPSEKGRRLRVMPKVLTPERQRGIFPLPLPPRETAVDPHLSRTCQRRSQSRQHVDDWLCEMVVSLNSMYLGQEFMADQSASFRPSMSQRLCLERMRTAILRMGKPPEDLTGAGAFQELRANLGYSGDTPASLADFQMDKVSMPGAGGVPSSLNSILGPPEAQKVLEVLRNKMVSPGDVKTRKLQSGLKAPYFDPVLKSGSATYVEFLHRLRSSNLIEFRTEARERVGIFTVWKKSGKQRLVVDARFSNLWFESPEHVELATGAAFSQIEVDQGPPIEVAGVDIADAFYAIELPHEFRDLFALNPIRADRLDKALIGDLDIKPSQLVFPVFKVVPMGWNQALWVCQISHQKVVDAIKSIPPHLRFCDGKSAPAMRPFIHTQYVDNFVSLSQEPGVAAVVTRSVESALNDRGLPTHPIEHDVGGDTLGWHFDSEVPSVSVTPRRLWRLRLGIKELLRQGWGTGQLVERILGHLTFAFLLRRELLSCLQACYVFVRKSYKVHCRLWPEVVRELSWACSLLPLVTRDLSAPWCPDVCATDASHWGRGVAQQSSTVEKVRAQARIQDRWRFSHEQELEIGRSHVSGPKGSSCFIEHLRSSNSEKSLPVPELDVSFMKGPWTRVDSTPWSRPEPIVVLEGRAIVWTVQHLARAVRNHGCRHLLISDSMTSVLALTKGRGGSRAMNRICRQVACLALACNMQLYYRWCPSELNPADGPSRNKAISSFSVEEGITSLVNAEEGIGRGQSWRRQAAAFYDACRGDPTGWKDAAIRRAELAGWGTPSTDEEQKDCQRHQGKEQECKVCSAFPKEGEWSVNFSRVSEHHPGPRQDLCRGMGQVVEVCESQQAPHENLGPSGHSMRLGNRRPFLQGGQHLCRNDLGSCSTSESDRCAQVVDFGKINEGHAGLQENGPRSVSGPFAFPNAMPNRYHHDSAFEPADGSFVAGPDVESLQPSGRIVETYPSRNCGPKSPVQQVVSPVVCKLQPRRAKPAVQDRRSGRECVDRPTVPSLARSNPSTCEKSKISISPLFPFQHGQGGKGVQQSRRRVWIPQAWHSVFVPSASWQCKHRHVDQHEIYRSSHETGQVEKPVLTPSLRTGWSNSTSVQPTQQGRSGCSYQCRKAASKYHGSLRRLLKEPRRSIFLELFSGSGRVSKALKARHVSRLSVCEIDIKLDPLHDLCKKSLQSFILWLIHCDKIAGVWLGTPCTSWSRARRNDGRGPPPLRSNEALWGLPGLSDQDQERVREGNALARFSLRVFDICHRFGIPVGLENPATSRLWLVPQMQRLLDQPNVQLSVTDYCQDGMAWRKRTKVLSTHVDFRSVPRLCMGKHGFCSRTHHKHVQLSGTCGKGFLTRVAQPYPRNFCRRVATCFEQAIYAQRSRPIYKLLDVV